MLRMHLLGCIIAATVVLCTSRAQAQAIPPLKPAVAPPVAEVKLPVIPHEPRTIDPATHVPAKLAVKASVDFSDATLGDIAAWLRTEQKLAVVVKTKELEALGASLDTPIADRLNAEPIYLLLNRLHWSELAWYYRDDVLYLTSQEDSGNQLLTVPYNVGDLFDGGYDADDLIELITTSITPDSWDAVGGKSAVNVIGDVMFISQTEEFHRQILSLLAALRKHGRQTFVGELPRHLEIWKRLEENVTVSFQNKPLAQALDELGRLAGIEIRLDLKGLEASGVRQRTPVSLALVDRKLKIALESMLADLGLAWVVRDGVLWISSPDAAASNVKVAVYDVRDLCRDQDESDALAEAITGQAAPDSWNNVGGRGTLMFARPGTLVISNTEGVLAQVLELLEKYRTALRASKPRAYTGVNMQEVVTVYYRMHATVASDLEGALKLLVLPDTWKNAEHPTAPGEILRVASWPQAEPPPAKADVARSTPLAPEPQAVLIVKHTRAAHQEIATVIQRVQHGDSLWTGPDGLGGNRGGAGGFGGGGGGGNKFGQGFFSVP